MLYNHFTEKPIGLQELIVTNIESSAAATTIYAEMKRKPQRGQFMTTGHR